MRQRMELLALRWCYVNGRCVYMVKKREKASEAVME